MIVLHNADRFRVLVPFVEFRNDQIDEGIFVVDGDSLADDRLLALAGRGLLNRRLLVHHSVLNNLNNRLNSADVSERARAQRALQAVTQNYNTNNAI